jgi:hypothetical protein
LLEIKIAYEFLCGSLLLDVCVICNAMFRVHSLFSANLLGFLRALPAQLPSQGSGGCRRCALVTILDGSKYVQQHVSLAI